MELLTLFGDIHENFYQLGLLDKDKAKDVHRDVKLLLNTPWKPVNITIEEVAKAVLKNTLLKKLDYYSHLKSYAQGLDVALEEVAYIMLIPEIVSCMSKWVPGMLKGSLGCSSFFMRNERGEVVHGRILDFPLQGSYDCYERAILYDLKGMPKMLGFGSAGIPYPSITLMTEDGMTLALHQKFSNVFNKDGIPIFSLIFDLIKNANDKKSVLEYLKAHESITTWALNMSFKNGDVLAADIMGKEVYANEYSLEDNGILYFCNKLENKALNQMDMIPAGIHQYNVMREEIAAKKIKTFLAKKERTDINLLQMMSSPVEQIVKSPGHYENYLLDTITPSSLTVMTLNPTAGLAYTIGGEAPKVYRNNVIEIKDCFKNPVQKNMPPKKGKTASADYYHGLRSLMNAQKGFDQHDSRIVYHNLQFAIDHLEHYPEAGVAKFYFLVAQYIFESHPKVLMNVLMDFKKLEGHLPVNLNDHCLLFIGRLERILGVSMTLEEDKIQHHKLRALYNFELKIPRAIFHLTTKGMVVPRIEIMDIIYIYIS